MGRGREGGGEGKNTCASIFGQITIGRDQWMNIPTVCKLDLMYEQKTEQNKFLGGEPDFGPLEKNKTLRRKNQVTSWSLKKPKFYL